MQRPRSLLTIAVALMIVSVRLLAPIERIDGSSAPISALAAVPPDLRAKPALNEYGFGGYLIFSHVRPFIDGRAELYGDAMLSLYDKIQAGDRGDGGEHAQALRDRVDDLLARRPDRRHPRPHAGLAAALFRRDRGRPGARGCDPDPGLRGD